MDKLEISEQMAKAIVEHFKKHEVGVEDNWLNIPMHEATLTTYIREAILEYLKKEELELVGEHFDKERE